MSAVNFLSKNLQTLANILIQRTESAVSQLQDVAKKESQKNPPKTIAATTDQFINAAQQRFPQQLQRQNSDRYRLLLSQQNH